GAQQRHPALRAASGEHGGGGRDEGRCPSGQRPERVGRQDPPRRGGRSARPAVRGLGGLSLSWPPFGLGFVEGASCGLRLCPGRTVVPELYAIRPAHPQPPFTLSEVEAHVPPSATKVNPWPSTA